MEYFVLGRLQARHQGVALPLRPGGSEALLLWLLLARGDVVPAEVLQDRMWGRAQPANPANALQTQVSHLRKSFARAGLQPVATRGGGYALHVDPDDVDAFRFERLLGDARRLVESGSPAVLPAAGELLDDALRLWRGEPLPELRRADPPAPEVVSEVTRLQELWLAGRELRAETWLGLGRHDEAVADLQMLAAQHPLRERLHELLVLGLYRAGRQGDALQAYQRVRELLLDELGIDPGPGLTDLERRVLNQAPTLLGTTPPPPVVGPVDHAAPDDLPPEPSPLVGRERDVDDVAKLLAEHRVVTLTGPAGVGKTRVAIAVARTGAGAGASTGACFVDLSRAEEDSQVAGLVAAARGVTTRPDLDPVDAMIARPPLAGLLVLDNCERVVAGAATLVSRLVTAWPALRVLSTSRRPLQLSGEAVRPVEPLPLPAPGTRSADEVSRSPAVELFLQRSSQRSVRVDDDSIREVAALCRDLDGLPLAIELAAAQTDVLGPSAIRHHLAERFDLLVDDSRDSIGRHRGLRAAIDWSIRLLSPEQAQGFARLAVFPATFDVAAVAAVTGLPTGGAIRLLTALTRQSLVRAAPGDRFGLLESLRAYAVELLAADPGREAVAATHAAFYARLAEHAERQVRAPDQTEQWARLRAELPNLRASLEWCFGPGDRSLGARTAAALTWVWIHEGALDEADRWLGLAAGVDGLEPPVRADVLTHVAMLSSAVGRFEVARLAAVEALAVAGPEPGAALEGKALLERGMAEWALLDLPAAAATHDRAAEVLAGAGDDWGAAFARMLRARTAIDAGDPAADDLAAEGLAAARDTGDRALTAVALQQTAQLALARADSVAAAELAAESLRLVEEVDYAEGIIAAQHLLGRAAQGGGDLASAYATFRRSLDASRRIGHHAALSQALVDLAGAMADAGDTPRARALLDLADRERARHRLPTRPVDARARVELLEQLDRVGVGGSRRYADVDAALADLPAAVAPLSPPAVC